MKKKRKIIDNEKFSKFFMMIGIPVIIIGVSISIVALQYISYDKDVGYFLYEGNYYYLANEVDTEYYNSGDRFNVSSATRKSIWYYYGESFYNGEIGWNKETFAPKFTKESDWKNKYFIGKEYDSSWNIPKFDKKITSNN